MKLGLDVNVWHSTSEIRELYVSRRCSFLTGMVHTDDYTSQTYSSSQKLRGSSQPERL